MAQKDHESSICLIFLVLYESLDNFIFLLQLLYHYHRLSEHDIHVIEVSNKIPGVIILINF